MKKYPNKFTIYNLYDVYPDEIINISKEQRKIEEHDSLILQFPIYWFNCPSLMKKWLDEVFTNGWTYGNNGNKLFNRNIALVYCTQNLGHKIGGAVQKYSFYIISQLF